MSFVKRIFFSTLTGHNVHLIVPPPFIWFHYRLIHRILPTQKYLYYMKFTYSPLCNFCNEEEDTFLHAFSECEIVNEFWNSIIDWVNQNIHNDIHLSKSDIFLESLARTKKHLILYILLICKMYIFRSARESNRLSLHEIKLKIQYYYQFKKKAFFSKGKYRKFTERWQDYLHMVEVNNWNLGTLFNVWLTTFVLYV